MKIINMLKFNLPLKVRISVYKSITDTQIFLLLFMMHYYVHVLKQIKTKKL